MAPLPNNPSVDMDAETAADLAVRFSDLLRREPLLFVHLNRLVGNRWEEFEVGFADIVLDIAFATGEQRLSLSAIHQKCPDLSQAAVDACEHAFIQACFQILPLHAAAMVAEPANRIAKLFKNALFSKGKSNSAAASEKLLAAADEALRVGALH
jgi:hypothetical protein